MCPQIKVIKSFIPIDFLDGVLWTADERPSVVKSKFMQSNAAD